MNVRARVLAHSRRRRGDALPPTASRDELDRAGRALRSRVPRRSHAGWAAPRSRRDPIATLLDTVKDLVPSLVRIRFGRMLESPFTFFRGAAAVMAADLARTPSTGIRVQACGDCHLLNFGGFATPERRLVFDINDFDETLPAPWEWDIKRLAVSFAVAARDKRLGKGEIRDAAAAAVGAYRRWTAAYAALPVLDAWYVSLDLGKLIEETRDPAMVRFARKRVRRALREHEASIEYAKLVDQRRRQPRIRDHPPLIYHLRDSSGTAFRQAILRALARYRESMPEERRLLFDRYQLVDTAVKVVGIGSVGTLCAVILLMAGGTDPLFLQLKQARASVLEPYAGRSVHPNHGQRVVVGQHIMQSASDIFLGWTTGDGGRHFFVRQLRDVKVKPMVEVYDAQTLCRYAGVCGRALARAHARSGRAAVLAGYMGNSARFDAAVARFAVAYAEQNERDHAALVAAVRAGRVAAVVER